MWHISIMSAVTSSSPLQLRNHSCGLPSLRKSSIAPQLNVTSLNYQKTRAGRFFAVRQSTLLEKKFLGTRLRGSGSEKQHIWQSDGPGRAPKLRVVVRSSLSGVPEKPLGLYDPSFDKDSCGVGFVAELSGESSHKTVCIIQEYSSSEGFQLHNLNYLLFIFGFY